MIEREWPLVLGLFGITLVAVAGWLRGSLLASLGGGIMLFLVGTSLFAFRIRFPTASLLLSRIAVLAYALLLLNLTRGLESQLRVSNWALGFAYLVPLLASIFSCLAIASSILTAVPSGVTTPGSRERLGRRLAFLTLGALIPFPLIWALSSIAVPAYRMLLGPVVAGTIVVHCASTGFLLMQGLALRAGAADVRPVSRGIYLYIVPWLLLGLVTEAFRGEWLIWLLSATTLILAIVWGGRMTAYQLLTKERAGEITT